MYVCMRMPVSKFVIMRYRNAFALNHVLKLQKMALIAHAHTCIQIYIINMYVGTKLNRLLQTVLFYYNFIFYIQNRLKHFYEECA